MNDFYLNNKEKADLRCYEATGVDVASGIRFSIALAGTAEAAERALEEYVERRLPAGRAMAGARPDVSHLLRVEQTTIAAYRERRFEELEQRMGRILALEENCCLVQEHWAEVSEKLWACAQSAGRHEATFGDGEEAADCCCEACTLTVRPIGRTPNAAGAPDVELTVELHFRPTESVPHGHTRQQSVCLIPGTNPPLPQAAQAEVFKDGLRSFICQALRNHIYGFPPSDPLLRTPVSEDPERGREAFYESFRGFVLKPGFPAP